MLLRNIRIAQAEAKRFLDRIVELEVTMKANWTDREMPDRTSLIPVQSAALRRASLDLTRALAKMRRN